MTKSYRSSPVDETEIAAEDAPLTMPAPPPSGAYQAVAIARVVPPYTDSTESEPCPPSFEWPMENGPDSDLSRDTVPSPPPVGLDLDDDRALEDG